MNVNRLISIMAIIISTVAIIVSLGTAGYIQNNGKSIFPQRTLGSGIEHYNFKTPKDALNSIRQMERNEDIRAAWQYMKLGLLEATKDEKSQPTTGLMIGSATDIDFIKTFEIKGSNQVDQNGKVVAFIKYKQNGIEYHPVMFFKKTSDGTFYIDSAFYPGYEESKFSEEDKYIKSSIDYFERTGNLLASEGSGSDRKESKEMSDEEVFSGK